MKTIIVLLLLLAVPISCFSQATEKPRARDLGISFKGTPGKFNAITDVPGVQVGHSTIIRDSGTKAVRTGVTAILPKGNKKSPVYSAWYTLNGNGEMTGTTWVQESGFLETPVMITNTNSVGTVRDATIKWMSLNNWHKNNEVWFAYPVVAETWDGTLNDILGFHIKEDHAFQALNSAATGKVAEGNVGGGTGMMCLGFKGGIGTSSRSISLGGQPYTVAALVQSNFGGREQLTITGIPIGLMLMDTLLTHYFGWPDKYQPGSGSIIVVVATDVPLLPHQLKRVAQRVPIGIGRTGGEGSNFSGDIFIAFSTANETAYLTDSLARVQQLPNEWIDGVFEATIQSVEEAIINAMVAAETMEGIYGNIVPALPHDKVNAIMAKYRIDIARPAPIDLKPVKLSQKVLAAYQGEYFNFIGGDFKIMQTGSDLTWQLGKQTGGLIPLSETLFFSKEWPGKFQFGEHGKTLVYSGSEYEILWKKRE